jgi:acyl-CoA synthetase (NDP forming)
MNSKKELIAQIDALYHPRSVAIIGLPRGVKTGKLFLMALLDQKFPGKIYAVHPSAGEIDGIKAYPRVSAIPGPVDLAIVLVPHQHTLAVVKECADKGVKGAVLFTAGYKETGTEAGMAQEAELLKVARSSGMRLIGPNGMGLYSPKSGLSFFRNYPESPVEWALSPIAVPYQI